MKKYHLLFVFICLSVYSIAQLSEKDSLITAVIYDDTLGSPNEATELWISKKLKGKTLKNMVDENIISREDMRDLALPLGVFKNKENVNFTKGMIDMWKMKAAHINRKSNTADADIMVLALEGIEQNLSPKGKMTLLIYRDSLISPATKKLKVLHQEIKKMYSDDRAVFMDLIAENLSPNVILGFNIQELLPPTHMLANGKIKSVNPIFKAYYFDRLLSEAGVEFIHYFPSRYDQINSYGPFQITGVAVADIQANTRLINSFKLFKNMGELKTVDDHILLATIFAYDNWERLSYLISLDGSLATFNDYFKDYTKDEQKTRILRLFISGMTACMHHDPPATWKVIRNYLKEAETLDKLHYECISEQGGKQLRKYYKSSVEAYLIMKVYHELLGE
ncbi:MAG: hypothetical protein P1P88_24990 [Bacteroidales bacterium]|nr:hypothetical protein [Bacteroidales bacterium]